MNLEDVIRETRQVDEVVYRMSAASVERAILDWLDNEHGAAFNQDTELSFDGLGGCVVKTPFVRSDA